MEQELIELYEKTIEENVAYLRNLEDELFGSTEFGETMHKSLIQSTKNLTDKWRSQEKYIRTAYAMRAIPDYPDEVKKLSIFLDANINLMDDILDENLSREEMALYLVELLRVLSIKDGYPMTQALKQKISDYFNKIIFVAISEGALFPQFSKQEKSKLLAMILRSYFSRSIDMDLFLELPLHESGCDKENMNALIKAGRVFRVMNLAKKDFMDIEHDKEKNIINPVSVAMKKGISPQELIDYLYENTQSRIIPTKFKRNKEIMRNLQGMALEEKQLFEMYAKKRVGQ